MLSLLTHKTFAHERFVHYPSVCPEAIRMNLPGDLRPLTAVKSMIDRLRLVLLVGAIILTGAEVQAQTRVLVLGGSEAYNSFHEAAFPTASVATHLQEILAGDALVSQPVTVQNTDTFQTLNIANEHGQTDYTSKTLMSWYYWRDTHPATLTLLKNNWNYVVMVDDPYVASTFPEYHLEGVLRISQEVKKGGATPISVMTWSSGATAVRTFGAMAYRVGDGLGVAVAPAGYAWNNVSATLKDTGTRPSARGTYVTAATVYSRIYNRSAKLSTFVPAGMSQADRDALAEVALTTVQTEATKTHYSGTLRRPTHFATPLVKNRAVTHADYNSSTENGITTCLTTCFGILRTSNSEPYSSSYQSFPNPLPVAVNFAHARWFNFDYPLWWRNGIATPDNFKNYASFDYQDYDGDKSMIVGMDSVINPGGGTAAARVTNSYMDRGEFFVPIRVLWPRINEAQPQILFQATSTNHQIPENLHMSEPVRNGVAAMMTTLLTGRCPIGDEPAYEPTSLAWQNWFCRKMGYEIAIQHATLNARMHGFVVLPSSISATKLKVGSNETMPVKFRYAPTANVTVNVTCDQPGAVIITPATLTFTPDNYATVQNVVVNLASGARPSGSVTFSFDTTSTDPIFNAVHDEWAYVPAPALLWDGGGSDNNWSTAGNWNPDMAPVNGGYGDFTFASANRLSPTNNLTGVTANSITFNSTAGAFTLGGNAITLNGNIGFSANPPSTVTQTINLDLILNASRTISTQANGNLVLGGVISESGVGQSLSKDGNGNATLSGANTFSGILSVNAGTLNVSTIKPGGQACNVGAGPNLRIGYLTTSGVLIYTGTGDTTNRTVQIGAGTASNNTGGATIQADGTGALIFNGSFFNIAQVGVAASTARLLTLQGSNTGPNTIAGVICDHTVGASGTGAVALTKAGTGTWVLSAANTYTGPTTLTSGQLVLAGTIASNLTANGGTLAPNGTPATTGSVTIGSASLFQVRINGPTVGTQYDQLTAAGAVTLGGSLSIVAGAGLPLGTSFVILNKTSAGAVSGTFAGMPDGSLITAGGYLWQINYAGGDGNDVVLRTTTGLETWCFNQFGTIANTGSAADGADYDGDGVLNLVEYAFGLNPKDASSNQIPAPQVSGGNFTVSFTQPVGVSGITYHAEWSATIANDWVEIADSDPSPAGFSFSVPMGTNTKMFVRYRITSP